ncbi:MAG: MoaD/ThiS family protein [Nitrospira sp.]|nr:MoaD/ThiS family protein [Nitrospira sp.]
MVTILVFGKVIQDAVGDNEFSIESAAPTTVRKLIEANAESLGPLLRFIDSREALISVNKKVGTQDTVVKDGDTVKVSFQSRMSYDGMRDIPS